MKRITLIAILVLVGCGVRAGSADDLTVQQARDQLKRGQYKQALAAFAALLEKNPKDSDALQGVLLAKLETGDYSGAEAQASQWLSTAESDAPVRILLAEALLFRGKSADAGAQFERAGRDSRGVIWLKATYGQARADLARGKTDEANSLLLQFIRYYNQTRPRTAEELTIIGRGLALLQKFRDANEVFMDARSADRSYADAFAGQGALLNEKYQYPDASSLFEDGLKINPNSVELLTGLALTKISGTLMGGQEELDKALTVNPNYCPALALKAKLEIESEKPERAAEIIRHILSIDPDNIDALAESAAIAYLKDKKSEQEALTKQALAANPAAGRFFDVMAHFAMMNRRYTEAVEFEKRAVEVSPTFWSARAELGIELLRLGREGDGKAELEKAFAGDPFNPWTKNTLDLLDSMRAYQETLRGPFLIKVSEKESGGLSAYAGDMLEEALARLSARYKFTPKGPITVEIFDSHADFAVRSLGMPGLGALGVCFGQVIAMDGPSARDPGRFNWGGTLWHEFTHVITLEMTDHRIPRWFSEGLSVLEERRARQGWGDNWSIERLRDFSSGKFVKIADLDAAFTRPKTPDQVGLGYFEASLVCEYVEGKYGFDGILRMLALYKEGLATPEVFKQALGMDFENFDLAFHESLKGRTASWSQAIAQDARLSNTREGLEGAVIANPNSFFAHLRLGTIYKSEGNTARAIAELRQAEQLFPFYFGEFNPYQQLADIYKASGDRKAEAAELDALSKVDETAGDALKRLVELRIALNDKDGALAALRAAFFVYPLDPALHKLAGDLYLDTGKPADAGREFQAVLALGPANVAESHYDLARSLMGSGKPIEAKREVLHALEAAPEFEKAQELLLRIREKNP